MGTLESKVKEGYSVRQRPLFKSKLRYGTKPIAIKQNKSHLTYSQVIQSRDFKYQGDPLRISIRTNDTEHSEFDHQLQNNSFSYPSTAIGVISCIMGGSLKRSTGTLISSNVVLTAAHNLCYMEAKMQPSKVTFRLNYGPEECEQYEVQKILIPEEFKNGIHDHLDLRELFPYDFGVLILGTHVDVEKYGTLGFDFTSCPIENSDNLMIYGYQKRNGTIEIESGKIKAAVGDIAIRYNSVVNIDTVGGPVVEIRDQNCIMIGVQNGTYHLYEKRALRLNMDIFERLCQWATHDEEEIDLRDKQLGKEGMKKLIKLKWTSLASINLARNNLGKEGLKYLTRCEWNNLHHLDIGGNDIKKEGVRYLVDIPMKNLNSLNMWGNGIEAQGAYLLLSGNWKKLNNINLYNNQLDNDGIRFLIKANWEDLENLNLGKNKISDAGIRLLLYSNWKNIVSLNLWSNVIKDPKTISSELKKHFNKMKFLYL